MAESTVKIRNLRADTIQFGPFVKSKGDKPTYIDLGSSADEGLVNAPQPVAEIPAWAFAKLKGLQAFQTMVENRHISIGGA